MDNHIIKPLKNNFIYGIVTALLLSLFIYLEHFLLPTKFLSSISAVLGIYLLLNSPRKATYIIGFFIGILWFYWIGLSFRFTEFPFLAYLIPLGIGAGFAFIFLALYWIENIYYRAFITLFAFDILEPFGFTWFKFETLLSNSFFKTDKIALGAVIVAVVIISLKLQKRIKFLLATIVLAFAIDYSPKKVELPNLDIALTNLTLDQKTKWLQSFRKKHTHNALEIIQAEIENGRDVIVLPESAFPIYLNLNPVITERLKQLSHQATIIVGSLQYADNRAYNSTYFFQNGELEIANKVYLVPFGESSPIAGVFGKWVNDTFFGGSDDFTTAKNPTDFTIGNYTFRNAICYEGGVEEMFKDAPQYMIVTSNNAWFTPSIMPTVQKLVMLTWARKYSVKIFHSSNMSKSEIIY